jgi:putative transposase
MSHTYCCSLFHCVFSTKSRRKAISPDIQETPWPYIGGIARNHNMHALSVGGFDDHAHVLLSMPSTITIADAMRMIKSDSSRWMRETAGRETFEWQEGYGAFSIGHSQLQPTLAYIASQREHHKKHDFQTEFIAFLKKNRIDYDPRYVWG